MDRFEVGFNVDVNDEWPPVGVEFLWLAISSNGYQVLTAPFFLKDLSVGDILTIDLEQKGGQRFALSWSHLEKSSRSTVGVMIDEGVKIDDFLVAIEEAGGRISHLEQFNIYCLDLPQDFDMKPIDDMEEELGDSIEIIYPSFRIAE